MNGEGIKLSLEQEQNLVKQVLDIITPLLPQHVRANIKPAIKELVYEEDSVFDTTARSPSALNTSTIDSKHDDLNRTISCELEKRLTAVESELNLAAPTLQKLDEVQDALEKKMQVITDHNLAKVITEEELPTVSKPLILQMQNELADIKHEQDAIKQEQDVIKENADCLEQYGRFYILDFLNFAYNVHPSQENCALKILDFLNNELGIKLHLQDIDIAHRMPIAEERKKQGKNYLPPIYCKFVHKSVVHEILRKRHLLKNMQNRYGQKYVIQQNLTLCRRRLWTRIQNELTSFKFSWIRNGKLFVRKQRNTRPINITGERKFQELLDKQNCTSKLRNGDIPAIPSTSPNKVLSTSTIPANTLSCSALSSSQDGNVSQSAETNGTHKVNRKRSKVKFTPYLSKSPPLCPTQRPPRPHISPHASRPTPRPPRPPLYPHTQLPSYYPPLRVNANSLLSPQSIQSMYSHRNTYGGESSI